MRTKDQLAFINPSSRYEFRVMSDNTEYRAGYKPSTKGLVAVIYYQRNRVTDDWEPTFATAFPEHYTDDQKIAIWEKCVAAIQAEIKNINEGDFS